MNSKFVIKKLGLLPLPIEGGFFKVVDSGPKQPNGRPENTSIYYLITPESFRRYIDLNNRTELFKKFPSLKSKILKFTQITVALTILAISESCATAEMGVENLKKIKSPNRYGWDEPNCPLITADDRCSHLIGVNTLEDQAPNGYVTSLYLNDFVTIESSEDCIFKRIQRG